MAERYNGLRPKTKYLKRYHIDSHPDGSKLSPSSVNSGISIEDGAPYGTAVSGRKVPSLLSGFSDSDDERVNLGRTVSLVATTSRQSSGSEADVESPSKDNSHSERQSTGQDEKWDERMAASVVDSLGALLPAEARTDWSVSFTLKHLQNMLETMFGTWSDRPRGFATRQKLLNLKIRVIKERVENRNASRLGVSGHQNPKGLILHTEAKFSKSGIDAGGEELSRRDNWTAMLRDNEELRAVFSADLLPIIPQVAAETYDALEELLRTGAFAGVLLIFEIAVPLELKKEQQDFLLALCDFIIVRPKLIAVKDCHVYNE